jgi:hypothetical protein
MAQYFQRIKPKKEKRFAQQNTNLCFAGQVLNNLIKKREEKLNNLLSK